MLNLGETQPTAKKVRAILPDPDAAAAVWLAGQIGDAAIAVRTVTGKLTPSLARLLLARNPDNRRLSADAVEKYARDIANGNWRFNGEPIVIAKDGLLNDGQHRCEAVVMAGEAISVVFVFGVDRESRFTLDQGKMRQAGDYLGMHGHSDPVALAAAAAMLWQFRSHGRLSTASVMRPTKGEVLAIVGQTPTLAAGLDVADRKGCNLVGGRAMLAFCHCIFAERAGTPAATAFIDSLLTGAALPSRDPILYARNRLSDMRGRLRPNEKAELIIRAWNAHRRREQPKTLAILDGALPPVER
jgi:hypothetical protein